MASEAEIAIGRVNTRAFIAADEVELSLVRYAETRVPGGGVRRTGPFTATTGPARLIPTTEVAPEISLPDGRIVKPVLIVLMMPEMDIRRDDEFTHDGIVYSIAAIGRNSYEVKGQAVIRRG